MCYKCGTDDETYNPKTDSCNSCMPNLKPRKHATLIKAWADGAEIQILTDKRGWRDCPSPTWYGDEYRIKPKTIKFRNALMTSPQGILHVSVFNREPSTMEKGIWFVKWLGDWQEVEL